MEGQGDVFLLIGVLPGLEWLGHGRGVFIVVEELAQLGRASGGGAWRSAAVVRGEGHGVTSGLSVHGAAAVGPVSRPGVGNRPARWGRPGLPRRSGRR